MSKSKSVALTADRVARRSTEVTMNHYRTFTTKVFHPDKGQSEAESASRARFLGMSFGLRDDLGMDLRGDVR